MTAGFDKHHASGRQISSLGLGSNTRRKDYKDTKVMRPQSCDATRLLMPSLLMPQSCVVHMVFERAVSGWASAPRPEQCDIRIMSRWRCVSAEGGVLEPAGARQVHCDSYESLKSFSEFLIVQDLAWRTAV